MGKNIPLRFKPGVYRNGTRYQAKGRWYDTDLMRFIEGALRPIGGWEAVSGSGSGSQNLTATFDADAATDPAHGAAFVDFDDAPWFSKVNDDSDATFISASCVGAVNKATFALSFGTLASRPASGSTVTVVIRARLVSGGPLDSDAPDITIWDGAPYVGTQVTGVFTGDDMSGNGGTFADYTFTTTLDSDIDSADLADIAMEIIFTAGGSDFDIEVAEVDVTFVASADITQGQDGGGTPSAIRKLLGWRNNAANAAQLAMGAHDGIYRFSQGALTDITIDDLTAGLIDSVAGVGPYGNGNYSAGNYGVGDAAQGTFTEAASWQLDTFGEYLVGVLQPSDGRCLYWDTTGVMQEMAGSPVNCDAIVVTPERFVMALGADGDPRRVEWPSQESLTDWTPTSVNTAGGFTLTTQGSLMCGIRGKNETLLFTDKDLFAAQYIGGVLIYSFKQVGSECGIVSRHAAVFAGGKAVWMGQRGFFLYDGFTRPLPCDVSDYVFSDFNRTQRAKVWALPLTDFGEVWWFYPSGGNQEPDRYVMWNYRENHWATGNLSRLAGIDAGVFEYPIMVDATPTVYDHERGSTKTGAGTPYAESGPIELGAGEQVMHISRIVPDEATIIGQELGSSRAYLYSSFYPSETETQNGPYTLANPTDVRLSARLARLRIEEIAAGDWRLGEVRLEVQPEGLR